MKEKRGVEKFPYSDICLSLILIILCCSFASAQEIEDLPFTIQAKAAIKQKAVDVAKQIEIYLEGHPDMTIKDLQEDKKFQDIAVQQVGKTGYTAVTDYDTLVCRFHSNPQIVDMDLSLLADKLPGFWEVMARTKGGVESEGIYDWEEADGSIKQKYMYIALVNAKTAEGIGLHVAATTYLDEYKEAPLEEERQALSMISYIMILVIIFLVILLIFYYFQARAKEKKEDYGLKRFLFGKISRKIAAYFVVIVLLFMITGMTFSYFNQKTILEEQVMRQLNIAADSRADHLRTFLYDQKEKIEIAATHQELSIDELKELIKLNKEFYEIFVMDSKGIITASSDESKIGLDRHNDVYFINARDKTYIKDAYFSEDTQRNAIAVSTPFHGGVLAARIDLSALNQIILGRTGLGETGEIYLVNKEDYIITPSRFKEEIAFKQKVDTENSRNCFNAKEHISERGKQEHIGDGAVMMFKDYSGVYVLGTHVYIQEMDWCLLAEIDEAEAIGVYRKKLFNMFLGMALTIIIFTVLLALFFARIISKPIIELNYAAEELEKGNFKVRTDIKTGDEIEQLSHSFNKAAIALGRIDEEHKQVDRAKTEFLSITSHELRSPMTPMRAQLQMLIGDYFGKLNPKQKESATIVLRNTERLDKIILDFLEISRIEAARLKFHFVKTDLTQSINRIIEEMKGFETAKNIEIISKIGKLPVIEVDPDRVMQVLRNLLNNAKKFSKENTKIIISSEQMGNMIQFGVKDNGIGMTPETQKRVFEPFYQGEQTMYRKYGGTGLGLAICKGIVESQNGKIWVNSEVGKGSTFYFTIPMTPVRDIKPIKLLFSSENTINAEVKRLFKNILGPMGGREFDDFEKMSNMEKKAIIKYFDDLAKKKVISKEQLLIVDKKVNFIFKEEKKSVSEKDIADFIKKPLQKVSEKDMFKNNKNKKEVIR